MPEASVFVGRASSLLPAVKLGVHGLSDELGHAASADQRLDAPPCLGGEADLRRLVVQRRASHAAQLSRLGGGCHQQNDTVFC